MSLLTIEVSIDHGRVTPIESFSLPETGRGLLTILPEKSAERDPFTPHPVLSKGRILADPTEALSSEDWPETERWCSSIPAPCFGRNNFPFARKP